MKLFFNNHEGRGLHLVYVWTPSASHSFVPEYSFNKCGGMNKLTLAWRGIARLQGQWMIQCDACVFCAQSRLALCEPVNCSPAGSSAHGIFQARILEWVSISFSRGSSQPRHWTLLPWQADSLPPGKPPDACRFNKFSLCPQSASIILKGGEMDIILLLGSLQIYISPQSFSHIKRAFFSTLKT